MFLGALQAHVRPQPLRGRWVMAGTCPEGVGQTRAIPLERTQAYWHCHGHEPHPDSALLQT